MRLSALVAIVTVAIVLGSTQIGASQTYGHAPTAACGDGCGPTCAPTCNGHCSPFKLCLPIIPPKVIVGYLRSKVTCGSGCSDEVYWGEWWSDPPKCGPCDCNGNYVGPTGRPCHPGLLGIRYNNRGCGCGACGGAACTCGSTCGGDCGPDCGCGHAHGGVVTHGQPHYASPQEGEIIYEDAPVMTSSRQSGPRVYAQQSYSPQSYPTSTTVRSGAPTRNPRNLGRDSY